jgi:hypothetical protein
MSEDAPVNTGAVAWPDDFTAGVMVRRMQAKLHRWAGEDPSRCFGDLFNLVYDPAFLVHARERVSTNKGAQTAGIDKATAAMIETQVGVVAFLGQIRDLLKSGEFRPVEVRQVMIPKGNTGFRPETWNLTRLPHTKYQIEVLLLPEFGQRALRSLEAHEIAAWEKWFIAQGYRESTARDARATLANILGDAIPRYIQLNPAARKRGKGRRGQRRIERAEKAWPTALEALLFAERCAALSGSDADFVLVITMAYTGMRWSEVMGLSPKCVHKATIDINWKLYELNVSIRKSRDWACRRTA